MASTPLFFYHPGVTAEVAANTPLPHHDNKSAVDSWVVPTYNALCHTGIEVELGSTPPRGGIVVASSYSLPGAEFSSEAYVVSMLADGFVHERADFTVVQNAEQLAFCTAGAFMPHWPEKCLIARDASRSNDVKTMAYFGHISNLDPALACASFAEELVNSCGIELLLPGADRCHDYREVDLALALRPKVGPAWEGCKPATKLYNAWLAGVPLVGGLESSFQAAGVPGLDFAVANDAAAVLRQAAALSTDRARYACLRERCALRARDYSEAVLTERWADLFLETIIPLSHVYSRGRRARRLFNKYAYRLKRRGSF